MDAGAAELASAIGRRVKRERHARHWTLDELADAAGVSRRLVINVEKGAANPSVAILLRLSDALGIGLPALVEPPQRRPLKVTRTGEGAVLWNSQAGGRGVLVAGTQPPDVVELWDWTLAPADTHESDAHARGTKELLQVQHGEVTVTVAGEQTSLVVGDAITFDGDLAHSYTNPGDESARFLLAVFEPGVGSGPGAVAGHG
jgi:transcriptional regulator with XRE-family HTH domain